MVTHKKAASGLDVVKPFGKIIFVYVRPVIVQSNSISQPLDTFEHFGLFHVETGRENILLNTQSNNAANQRLPV